MCKKDKKKKKFMQRTIVVLLCLVMVLAGFSVGIVISNVLNNNKSNNSNKSDALFDIRSDSTADTEEYADNILIPCWDSIEMVANQINQSVCFYNPPSNDGIQFQLVLTLDDGTELYSSELIPSGKALYNVTLEKSLEPGTYNANLQYNCYSANGYKLNGSNLQFNLIMEDKDNE